MDMAFVKVLNMSISASWLVVAVLVLRFLLKKSPKWIHVALWALVAFRLICPFSIESAVSLIPSTQTVPEDIFYMEPIQHDQNVILEIVEPRPNVNPVDVELDKSVGVVQTWELKWSLLWPVGMVGMLAWALASYSRLRRKVAPSIDVGNGVYICDYIATPFILGIVKPKIYLPSAMEPDSASHVLSHERAHIARKDHWWKPFGYLLLAVHWFNPLMWLAYILLCRDIELACDEKVIRDMESPQKKAYSEALLSCSVNRRQIAACPLAFGEVGVKERVRTVLNYKKPAFWIVLVAILALTVTGVCFLTDPVTERDVGPMDAYALNEIYWAKYLGTEYTATIPHQDEGHSGAVKVTYDGEEYVISDDSGRRSYKYCVKGQAESEPGMYTEYFFLTDDPEMTAQKYLEAVDILPTELLYIDTRSFDVAKGYGDVPASMRTLFESGVGGTYCQNSLFQIRNQVAMSSTRVAYEVKRVDYNGNVLCEAIVKGVPNAFLELENGGFVAFSWAVPDEKDRISCFDESGNLRWFHTLDDGTSGYVCTMYQHNGDIYCFGTAKLKDKLDDVFIWRFSPDGELKQKANFGGSDFDSVLRVLETEAGFTIYGRTQSGDGDMSFSKDGYGVGFRAEVSDDLQLLRIEEYEDWTFTVLGYHEGQPVFSGDPILKVTGKDNFPKDIPVGSAGFFDWEDGYVIVRSMIYEQYPYQNPLISMSESYRQTVMTGYDSDGNPLWQTAGAIHVD